MRLYRFNIPYEVFHIGQSKSLKMINCDFLEKKCDTKKCFIGYCFFCSCDDLPVGRCSAPLQEDGKPPK